jgi:hypothetical protein
MKKLTRFKTVKAIKNRAIEETLPRQTLPRQTLPRQTLPRQTLPRQTLPTQKRSPPTKRKSSTPVWDCDLAKYG